MAAGYSVVVCMAEAERVVRVLDIVGVGVLRRVVLVACLVAMLYLGF